MSKIAQRPDERRAFVALMLREGVRSYLEIGLREAATFRFVGEHLPRGSRLVGVDLPGHSAWGVDHREIEATCQRIKAEVRTLRRCGQNADVVIGDSADPIIVALVANQGPYDLAFIDGDHTAAGVRSDWQNYGPMARMVAFHDIDAPRAKLAPERLAQYGVHTLWAELTQRYRHEAIIGARPGMGIGVIWTH